MADVFLSYSRKNIDFAERLVEDLTDRGVNVWFDKSSILAGAIWSKEIEDGIDEAIVFIILVSSHSKTSKYVDAELNHATKRNKPIIPLLIESVELPLLLGSHQAIDFIEGEIPYDEHLERLLLSLEKYGIPIRLVPPSKGKEILRSVEFTDEPSEDEEDIEYVQAVDIIREKLQPRNKSERQEFLSTITKILGETNSFIDTRHLTYLFGLLLYSNFSAVDDLKTVVNVRETLISDIKVLAYLLKLLLDYEDIFSDKYQSTVEWIQREDYVQILQDYILAEKGRLLLEKSKFTELAEFLEQIFSSVRHENDLRCKAAKEIIELVTGGYGSIDLRDLFLTHVEKYGTTNEQSYTRRLFIEQTYKELVKSERELVLVERILERSQRLTNTTPAYWNLIRDIAIESVIDKEKDDDLRTLRQILQRFEPNDNVKRYIWDIDYKLNQLAEREKDDAVEGKRKIPLKATKRRD